MTITGAGDGREGASTSGRSTMSLTYSDFLYTRSEHDYADGNGITLERSERRSLPSDFKPIQETVTPFLIQSSETVSNDFILIAEFSELEGPIPLCTVSNDAAEKTDIKLGDFVVHLMSTDYQVNTVGQFRICQDTQVMRKNVFPDVHVFMQYFTLYDLKARGFVRPFCFGYVTKDHTKLDKCANYFIAEFGKVTAVLEYCNRQWFSEELKLYLEKLQNAKDSFIKDHCSTSGPPEEDSDNQSDEFVDSETVTLAQIAHQYSEIRNILTIVEAFDNSNRVMCEQAVNEMTSFFERPQNATLHALLTKCGINDLGTVQSMSLESFNIPLVHPLRMKHEPLRTLTTMGGMGTVHLVRKLMEIYDNCKLDTIFAEMTEQTNLFRQHVRSLRNATDQLQNQKTVSSDTNSPTRSSGISSSCDLDTSAASGSAGETSFVESDDDVFQRGKVPDIPYIRKKELYLIIEKLHMSFPIISDSKSGSYHTVSEEDSDVNAQSHVETGIDGDGSALLMFDKGSIGRPNQDCDDIDQWKNMTCNTLNSFSSDDDISMGSSPQSSSDNCEETITKEPWWTYASRKLVRNVPGYGLANFFRRYHQVAHHILYSILLGRPILLCGEEKLSRKISRIITALIPLVPVSPSKSSENWKLLRWHRGILVSAHLDAYKLIGLCIPEKLEVHDLIPPRLVNLVTIFSVDTKVILGGPAYSGLFLENFEKKMQKHFYNSDVSILSYIGSIYAEIESKVYMYKVLEERYRQGRNKTLNTTSNLHLLFKELALRDSDVAIVKHLGSLLTDADECVNIL